MISVNNEEIKKYLVFTEEQAKVMLRNLCIIEDELPDNWEENLNSALLCMYRNSENRRNVAIYLLYLKFVEHDNLTEIANKLGVNKYQASDMMNRAECAISHPANKEIIMNGSGKHEVLKRVRCRRVYGIDARDKSRCVKKNSVESIMNKLGILDNRFLNNKAFGGFREMHIDKFLGLSQVDILQIITETYGLSMSAYKRLIALQKNIKTEIERGRTYETRRTKRVKTDSDRAVGIQS